MFPNCVHLCCNNLKKYPLDIAIRNWRDDIPPIAILHFKSIRINCAAIILILLVFSTVLVSISEFGGVVFSTQSLLTYCEF